MIELKGLNKYREKTEKQKALLKKSASDFLRDTVRAALRDLVLNTPQWSGDTAASWRIKTPSVTPMLGDNGESYDDWQDLKDVKFLGDKAAWQDALRANREALKSIRWNSTISIVNVSPVAEDLATDPDVEKRLRKGNYIPGDVMAVAYVAAKYKVTNNLLGRGIIRTLNYD